MGGKMRKGLSYAKNFLTTGALVETSPKVENEICKHVPKGENAIVIEYGMGYGNITRKILDKLSPTSKLYAFEVNKEFCEYVKKTIKDERLIVINDSAENLKLYVEGKVDAVISSLPFSLISEEKRTKIIQHSNDLLVEGAHFSQVLLSSFYQKTFQNGFGNCLLVKLPDFPIYYIYHSQKRSSK